MSNDRLRMAAFDRAIGVKKMNKQYIGVKFLNSGHHCPMTDGIVYNYFNSPDVSGDTVQIGDTVVVDTRYGPAVARVVKIFDTCRASCQVLSICQGPWAEDTIDKFLDKERQKELRMKKHSILAKIKKLTDHYYQSNPVELAKALTCPYKDESLDRLLKELSEIEALL